MLNWNSIGKRCSIFSGNCFAGFTFAPTYFLQEAFSWLNEAFDRCFAEFIVEFVFGRNVACNGYGNMENGNNRSIISPAAGEYKFYHFSTLCKMGDLVVFAQITVNILW